MNPWNAVFVPADKDTRELIKMGVYSLSNAANRELKKFSRRGNYWFRFSAENPYALYGYASCDDYSSERLPDVYDSECPTANWPSTPYTYEAYLELLDGGHQEFLSNDLREVLSNG